MFLISSQFLHFSRVLLNKGLSQFEEIDVLHETMNQTNDMTDSSIMDVMGKQPLRSLVVNPNQAKTGDQGAKPLKNIVLLSVQFSQRTSSVADTIRVVTFSIAYM